MENTSYEFFNFNYHSSLLLIGFIQAMVFSIFLIIRGRREERIADYFAAGILIVGALYVAQWMLGFANWYDVHDWRTTFMFYFSWSNLALLGPFIWLYFCAITNVDFRWKKRYWFHFLLWGANILPTLYIFAYDFIYHWLINGQEFTYFYNTRGPMSEWDNNANVWVFTVIFFLIRVQLVSYIVFTLLEFRKYQRYVREEFSNAEQLTFNSFRYSLLFLLGGMFLVTVMTVINRYFALNYSDAWNSFFVMSVIIYLASIQFYRFDPVRARNLRYQPSSLLNKGVFDASIPVVSGKEEVAEDFIEANVASHRQPMNGAAAAVKKMTATNGQSTADSDKSLHLWSSKLDDYLAQEKAYLNPELNLSELAKQLKTNTSQLSKVINGIHGLNFNDFINGFRCTTFIDALQAGEHHQMTLLSLALDSGFNSKATFNRAFKKYYGISPGEAAKRIDAGERIKALR